MKKCDKFFQTPRRQLSASFRHASVEFAIPRGLTLSQTSALNNRFVWTAPRARGRVAVRCLHPVLYAGHCSQRTDAIRARTGMFLVSRPGV